MKGYGVRLVNVDNPNDLINIVRYSSSIDTISCFGNPNLPVAGSKQTIVWLKNGDTLRSKGDCKTARFNMDDKIYKIIET